MGSVPRINKLTTKQTIFAREIIKGSNATQAALAAYQTNNVNSAKVIGSRLLTSVNVKEALEEALRSQGLTLDVLTKNIGDLASTIPAKVSGETVLKANIELLKLSGAYPDKKSYQYQMSIQGRINNMSYSEAKEELDKLNSSLIEFDTNSV